MGKQTRKIVWSICKYIKCKKKFPHWDNIKRGYCTSICNKLADKLYLYRVGKKGNDE